MLEFTRIAYSLERYNRARYLKWYVAKEEGEVYRLYVETDRGWERYAETDSVRIALAYLISGPEEMDGCALTSTPIVKMSGSPESVSVDHLDEAALEILAGHPALRDALIDTLAKGG